MEISSTAPLSGQPTLTNPLSQSSLLEGRETSTQSTSETQNTTTAQEQLTTTVSSAEVVNEANEAQATEFSSESIGRNIDLTA
ncbi:MAG: hypothetical protein HRT92_08665 [Piscirickettsiaceae bacterium]|nr:hypothetical protein [Piscirickettsiaceae bacterium]